MSTSRSSDAMNQRRKPQEFHLPDGRKFIVALPEDAATLKQRYDALPDTQAEVILHGSDEHHTYLAQSRDHHEKRRQTLREKHGPAFDEWESVQQQLDAVTEALDKLSDQTSALSANFSKFGFNATLRTYDDKEGGQTPAKGSRNSSEASTVVNWSDRNSGESIKLFRKPIIKQYFHKGLIWRASEETEVMSFELFFDLLYGMWCVISPPISHGSHLCAPQSVSSTSTASTSQKEPTEKSFSASSSLSACPGRSGRTSPTSSAGSRRTTSYSASRFSSASPAFSASPPT